MLMDILRVKVEVSVNTLGGFVFSHKIGEGKQHPKPYKRSCSFLLSIHIISYIISYYIISYHIISYHIISTYLKKAPCFSVKSYVLSLQ